MGHPAISAVKLLLLILLFALLGTPLVAYLWDTLNELVALHVNPVRLLIAIPVLLVFIGLLKLLAIQVRRWDAGDLT